MKTHYGREEDVGWLVVFGLAALRDIISVYIGPSSGERETEMIDEKKNVQTPTRTFCKRGRLLPYCNSN